MDLADIEVVVQWRPTCGLNTLFQRFGRAARERRRDAVAILLVDKKDMDDECNRQSGGSKRKATESRIEDAPPQKRIVLTDNGDRSAVPVFPQSNPQNEGVDTEPQTTELPVDVSRLSPASMDVEPHRSGTLENKE